MTALLCLVLAASAFSGEVQSDAQICKTNIEQAARKFPLVGSPPVACKVVDPACSMLQQSQQKIGAIQKTTLERCTTTALNHCQAYEEHIKAGMAAEASWAKVMHRCSPSVEKITPAFFQCICQLDKTHAKSGATKDAPGFIPPRN